MPIDCQYRLGMNWAARIKRFVDTVRECLSEVGMARLARKADVGADRLIDKAMHKVPGLRRLDALIPEEPKEPNLLREQVENMGGTEWIRKIAEQMERSDPKIRH